MRGARPSSRHCPESGRACALRRRHRRAWGPRAGAQLTLGAEGVRRAGGDTGARRQDAEAICPEARSTTSHSRAAQRGSLGVPAPPGGRARDYSLFLGDFGSCSPPRSDLRSLVMSPWPGLEQSQGCWQAAAIRSAQGEAQACCSRGGQ